MFSSYSHYLIFLKVALKEIRIIPELVARVALCCSWDTTVHISLPISNILWSSAYIVNPCTQCTRNRSGRCYRVAVLRLTPEASHNLLASKSFLPSRFVDEIGDRKSNSEACRPPCLGNHSSECIQSNAFDMSVEGYRLVLGTFPALYKDIECCFTTVMSTIGSKTVSEMAVKLTCSLVA